MEDYKGMRVAIIGSCVSRDIMQFLKPKEIKYFARTSFISLVSKPVYLDESKLRIDSNFVKRMVVADFDKSALGEILEFRPDIILIDFIDERFDIIKIGESYVTNSNYLIQSKALDEIQEGWQIIQRKNCHDLWYEACNKMISIILEMKCKVILHTAYCMVGR